MILKPVESARELRQFYAFPAMIYHKNPCHRCTEESLTRLLVSGPSTFHSHASVYPFLLSDNDETVGRLALIHDRNLTHAVQVAFFEAKPALHGVFDAIRAQARISVPSASKLIIGLNGHLNYGAGFLLNRFDQPPVFGLPYTQPYYPDYFAALYRREMVSFRFELQEFFRWGAGLVDEPRFDRYGITIRLFDPTDLAAEVERYTFLDNASFSDAQCWHWSNRLSRENFELFHPFRSFIRRENLLFAEKEGKPIGFLLWYPDFNELVPPGRDFTFLDLLKYRFMNPIRTMRLAEVAILPQYRTTPAVRLLILAAMHHIKRCGYTVCEGGFIFGQNTDCTVMTQRYIERAFNYPLPPYRRFALFEDDL